MVIKLYLMSTSAANFVESEWLSEIFNSIISSKNSFLEAASYKVVSYLHELSTNCLR